jgi:hypothetical protein
MSYILLFVGGTSLNDSLCGHLGKSATICAANQSPTVRGNMDGITKMIMMGNHIKNSASLV